MSQNPSIYRDGEDHISLEVPTVGGIVQVRLELGAAFTLLRLLELCVAQDPEFRMAYEKCLTEWKKAASR